MDFQQIWGQEQVVQYLRAGLAKERLAPSLILHGPEGVGKTFLALLLARNLICARGSGQACRDCSGCRKIDPPRSHHPDLRRIHPTGREIRIQQIRDLVREIQVRPLEGRRKIFLIEPADRMTTEASNALLKTLEEPPSRGAILLITPNYHSLLPTVRSRCQALRLQPLAADLVARFLITVQNLPEGDAELIASITEGRIARAATFDFPRFHKRRERLLILLADLQGRRYGSTVLHNAEQMANSVEELGEDLDTLLLLFRDIARLVYSPGEAPIANRDLREALLKLAERFSHRAYQVVERIEETRRDLQKNVNRYLATQVLLFDLAGAGHAGEPGSGPLRRRVALPGHS